MITFDFETRSHADLRAGACSFTHTRIDAHTDADGNGHRDAATYLDPHACADAGGYLYHRPDTYSCTYADVYQVPHIHAYAGANAYPDTSSYGYSRADTDANAYTAYADAHTDD